MSRMAQGDAEELDGFVVVSEEDYLDEAPDASPTKAPELLGAISRSVDGAAEAFWLVNRKIHDNPELGYQEFIAHDVLTRFMAARDGWAVTRSAYGLETAWVAVFDSGKRGSVVSFNAEMGRQLGLHRGRRAGAAADETCTRLPPGNRTRLRTQPHRERLCSRRRRRS